jgi:hypothetical protein
MYPFLYAVCNEKSKIDNSIKIDHFVVVIAEYFDYTYANTDWTDNPELPGGHTWQASLNIRESQHLFKTEAEALDFIKGWWKKQP